MDDTKVVVERNCNTEVNIYKVVANIGTKHEWTRPITLDATEARALADAIYAELGLGWLPYPENKPKEAGKWYMVQYEYPTDWKKHDVLIAFYLGDDYGWDKLFDDIYEPIIAFRELPAPYQP